MRAVSTGWYYYALVLRTIIEQPQTSTDVAKKIGACRDGVRRVLKTMQLAGLVRVREWVWPHSNCRYWMPVWAFEPGDDAPMPTASPSGSPLPRPRVRNDRGPARLPALFLPFALSMRALQEEPQTVSQLVDLTGAAICRVRGWLRYGRSIKLIRVSEWEPRPRGGAPTASYSLGDKPDAKRPAPLPRTVRDKRSRLTKRRRAENLKLIHALASNAGTYQAAA